MRPPTHSPRYDVDVAVVDEELQQLGLPREHSDALSGAIVVGRSEMQRRFRESSLRLPSLDLLQWCASPHVTLESRVLATRRSMRGVQAGGEVEGREEGEREWCQRPATTPFSCRQLIEDVNGEDAHAIQIECGSLSHEAQQLAPLQLNLTPQMLTLLRAELSQARDQMLALNG